MEKSIHSKAAIDVLAERQRQKDLEGWTEAHDDEHSDESLVYAAICYAKHAAERAWVIRDLRDGTERYQDEKLPLYWPDSWAESWWKPKSPRRDLVRAAALLLAEIERLDRAQSEDHP